MTIKGMLEKVRTVNLRAEVPQIILETSQEIVQLNRDQLRQGIKSNGVTLLEYKSFEYAERKHAMNPAPGFGNPDLYLEGDFYRGFQVAKITSRSFDLLSTDSKSDSLEEKYGEKIFGLTQKSRTQYALGVFYQRVKSYITGKTGLRFK